MASDRKIAANRENAKKSTGPRSEMGQRRSRRNAFRHGLAIDPGSEPSYSAGVEMMAKAIASACGQETAGVLPRQLAEAEIDLLRIREIRASLFNTLYKKQEVQPHDYAELSDNLVRLERYERRAFSRRKRVLRAIDQSSLVRKEAIKSHAN
jgi:hypothetical protein